MGSRTVPAPPSVPLVGDVARQILRQRLRAVSRAAATVSAGMPTGEEVHRLRVCTRRASAALAAFRELVPRSQRRWFQRSLRRERRAVGETRDLDVIIARWRPVVGGGRKSAAGGTARRRLVEILAKRRTLAGRGCVGLLADDWDAHLAALLTAMRADGSKETIPAFARRRSRRLVRRFLERFDRRLHDGREIHRLRIETKKLRYVLEALATGTPRGQDAPGDRVLRRLQVRLGEFTDRAAAADRLGRWSRREQDDCCRELLEEAHRRESSAAARARRDCIRWWSASRRERIARRLNRTLRRETA